MNRLINEIESRREGRMSGIVTRKLAIVLSCLFALVPATPGAGQSQTGAAVALSPAAMTPGGAMVYAEVRDLGAVLRWWDGSTEKSAWLKSANLEQFRNSKFFLKLASRLEQFSRSAGFEIDYQRLSRYAGRRSALALYNPGETEFLFLSELTTIERQATDLFRLRGRFQARQAAGMTYYLNQEGGRTVCYAEAEPYLLLATGEELMRSALALHQKLGAGGALADEPSWSQLGMGDAFHDARVFLDISLLCRNANFRREWIFGNAAELAVYRAAALDLQWDRQRIIENRSFLLAEAGPPPGALDANLVERFVPNGFEFAAGTSDTRNLPRVAARVEQAISNPLPDFARTISRARPLYNAYQTYLLSRPRTDFEKQSDEPDATIAGEAGPEAPAPAGRLLQLLSSANLRGVLEIGRSRNLEPDFLTGFQRAFILQGDPARLTRQQLQEWVKAEFRELYTAGNLGASWQTKVLAGIEYDLLISPALQVATGIVGGRAVIAAPPEYMDRIIQTHQANLPARFAIANTGGTLTAYANLNLRNAREGFTRLMNTLDYRELKNRGQGTPPLFFSQNLAGLLACLARIDRITLEQRTAADRVNETVVYSMAEPVPGK